MVNKNLILVLLLSYWSGQLKAGDPDPKVINSSSSVLKNGNIVVEYSVGEMAITTLIGSVGHVTQGFLQPIKSKLITEVAQEIVRQNLSVFPNPTTGQLFIVTAAEPIQQVCVYGMDGKMALSIPLPQGTIDLSGLGKGVYYLELRGSDNTKFANTKIIKQ